MIVIIIMIIIVKIIKILLKINLEMIMIIIEFVFFKMFTHYEKKSIRYNKSSFTVPISYLLFRSVLNITNPINYSANKSYH